MTISCALSHLSLPAHHKAVSAGERPAGGFWLARLRLNSDGVMDGLWIAATVSAPPRCGVKTSGRLLDDGAEREQRLLLERPADELQPERQALGVEAAGHGNTRQPSHVHGDCEH